jgi:hypothetical protein
MTGRRITGLILGITSLFMFSPLAMSLFWHPIPLFQDLGFERGSIAPPLAWILATITGIAYVLYTMKAIPLVLANPILQVIISGVAFGLAHWCWTLLAKRDFKATLPAILSTSILGIFLAIIYLAGGRNLGPCIFAHVLINIVIEPWLMLSAVSGKWRT